MTEDVNTYGHYLQLVAANMFYLVLAVLNQQKRSRGMLQTATQTEEGQECVPQHDDRDVSPSYVIIHAEIH